MEEKKNLLPLNLQFFAEDGGDDAGDDAGNAVADDKQTIEELKAQLQIAQNNADAVTKAREKEKLALDKALKEIAEMKRKDRANKTEAELEAENQRLEQEKIQEELNELRMFKRHSEAKDRYLLQGMDAETASKASEAEINGDMDALTDIQKKFMEAKLKAKEAEILASRPDVNIGGGTGKTYTKEQFDAMGPVELTKLKRENEAEYNRLMAL